MKAFSDEELKELLEEASRMGARKAIEEMTNDIYQVVGKKVINKLWQALGVMCVGFVLWAIQHGWFK